MTEFVQLCSQIISNLGVPVGCLIGSFWLLNKQREDHKAEVDALRTQFNSTQTEITKAINNNTVALEKLVAKING